MVSNGLGSSPLMNSLSLSPSLICVYLSHFFFNLLIDFLSLLTLVSLKEEKMREGEHPT